MGHVVDRLGTGKGSFDNVDRCGRNIVFRPQGDNGAASVEDIANKLKGGGAHGAVGIDAQGNVIDLSPLKRASEIIAVRIRSNEIRRAPQMWKLHGTLGIAAA